MPMERFFWGFLSCSGLWTFCMAEEYYSVTMNKNWIDAQQYCRDKYTDLVTIDNRNMKDLNGCLKGKMWIGLHYDWQWSMNDSHIYRTEDNWDENQPDKTGMCDDCAMVKLKNGKWHDVNCKEKHHFICYNESASEKYIKINACLDWKEAQTYCRKNHTDLATVRNQTEADHINRSSGSFLFIGLFRNWIWSDQTQLTFAKWKKRPDKCNKERHCVCADHEGNWCARKCTDEHSFVCYDDNLVLVKQNYTWEDAVKYCRNNHTGLVTVSSEKLQHWVRQKAKHASTKHVWLGLYYTCTLEFWFWESNERLNYTNWEEGYKGTREECGMAGALDTHTGSWVSRQATEQLYFICEKRGGGSGNNDERCYPKQPGDPEKGANEEE